ERESRQVRRARHAVPEAGGRRDAGRVRASGRRWILWAGRGPVKLTVLGSHGTWPRAGGAASGYLLSQDGFHLWLDAGTGTLAKLQEHVDPFGLGAVVVSHRHFDHFLDL